MKSKQKVNCHKAHSTTHYSHLSVETVELSAEQKTLAKEHDEKRGAKKGRNARIVELAEKLFCMKRGESFLQIAQIKNI